MLYSRLVVALIAACGVAILSPSAGCAGDGGDVAPPGADVSPSLGAAPDATPQPCVNLQCNVVACPDGASTTVSGTVYDPAGKVPLYNAIVYVPNAPVEKLPRGVTCDRCGALASGHPMATALTDARGHFVLENVPVGQNVPLVMQVGKWRRQIVLPSVTGCQDNPIDSDFTRLPQNQAEGDMPQIAITTGGCDALECLLRKIGIDDSEFTASSGHGRVHLYQGDHGATVPGSTDASTLWSDVNVLEKYDMALFSCECSENRTNKPPPAFAALHDYASAGGRIFGTHFQYVWFLDGPPDFQSTASYSADDSGGRGAPPYMVDQSFPKGQAFADWLDFVGATTTKGQIDLEAVMGNVTRVSPDKAQQWIYAASPQSTKYLSFNTPVGRPVAEQCGRVVYSDLHVATGSTGGPFPVNCEAGDLTAQEKALEFLFFDLSACVQDPLKPPPRPSLK